jgi:hypothetical protein
MARPALFACVLLAACDSAADRMSGSAGDAGLFDGERPDAPARPDVGAPDADFTGFIYAISRSSVADGSTLESYAVTAGFAEPPAEVCTDRTPFGAQDDCRVSECVPRTPEPLDGGVRPNAGFITVSGGRDLVQLFWFNGQYQPWSVVGYTLFAGGQTLSARADGQQIAGFSGEVVTPERPTLTTPAIPAPGSPLEISRDRAFDFTWEGVTRGELSVVISVLELNRRFSVTCRFPADSGEGEIPRAVLSAIPAGDGFYELRAENTTELTAGEYKVDLTAAMNVVDADRAWARGSVLVR